jgi:hypothetical protein
MAKHYCRSNSGGQRIFGNFTPVNCRYFSENLEKAHIGIIHDFLTLFRIKIQY